MGERKGLSVEIQGASGSGRKVCLEPLWRICWEMNLADRMYRSLWGGWEWGGIGEVRLEDERSGRLKLWSRFWIPGHAGVWRVDKCVKRWDS